MKTLLIKAFVMLVLCIASNGLSSQAKTISQNTSSEATLKEHKENLFEKYPWVKKHFNDDNKKPIEVSEVISNGNYPYLMIEYKDAKILYDKEGNKYCTNSESLDCSEFYKLSPGKLKWSRVVLK